MNCKIVCLLFIIVFCIIVGNVYNENMDNKKFFNEDPINNHLDIRFSKKNMSNKEKYNTLKELLLFFTYYCKKNNIKPILMYGGLIGYYFNKKMLPWDDDIDIILIEDSILNMKNYEDNDYLIEINPNSTNYSTDDKNNNISSRVISKKNGMFIDITYFKINKNKYICKDGNSYNINDIMPIKKTLFEDIEIYVPNNINKILIQRYGKKVLLPQYKNWKYKNGEWKKYK